MTQLSVEGQAHPTSLGWTCGQPVESFSRCWFSNRDFRYKSVLTQIPHDVALAPIPSISRKFFPPRGSNRCRIYNQLNSRLGKYSKEPTFTNSMAYGSWSLNALFTRTLQ